MHLNQFCHSRPSCDRISHSATAMIAVLEEKDEISVEDQALLAGQTDHL